MEEKELINLPESTKELVIRRGEALPVHEPEKVEVAGTINAPSKYWEKRKSFHKPEQCYVIFDKDAGRIQLHTNEKEHDGTVITGNILLNPDLKAFGINTTKIWSVKDLQQHLKMNRTLFADVDQCISMVTNLTKVKLSVQSQIEQESSTRGDKKDSFEVKVDGNIPVNFNLMLPVFVGYEPKKFAVEICFDVRERNISVWLESVELKEIVDKEKTAIFDSEIKKFDDIVCIEQ